MTETRCPKCNSANLDSSAAYVRERKIGETTVRLCMPAVGCRDCDEKFVDAETVRRAELNAALQFARRNVLSKETFRFIRQALGLQSKQLAMILGVKAESVSRWENGTRSLDDEPAWRFLRHLIEDHVAGRRSIDAALADARDTPKSVSSVDEIVVSGPCLAA